jgi:hypothetical protein
MMPRPDRERSPEAGAESEGHPMRGATIRRVASTMMLVGLVAGCGGAASPSASSSTSTPPSAAAPSIAASAPPASTEASAAPASTEPSLALPSFQLPSEAKDLEALLPGTVCGTAATKVSLSGASFAASASEEFKAVLQALGKSPSDVAFALAIGGTTSCSAGIFRIQGVDSSALQGAFEAQAQKSGDTFTSKTVGGKDVKIATDPSASNYLYFKGDAVIFATAKTEDQAASILQQLP